MKTVTKNIEVKVGKDEKTLTFHIATGNYNMETKSVAGLLQSFVSDKLSDNFINGTIRPSKVSQFIISNVEAADCVKTLSDYVDENIDTIVKSVNQTVPR